MLPSQAKPGLAESGLARHAKKTADFDGLENNGDELDLLKKAAADTIAENMWTAQALKEEREANSEGWKAHTHLNAAVARVEDGLVERGEDARLVVLAMIANEHILLLGKPGTGKYAFYIFYFSRTVIPMWKIDLTFSFSLMD